MRNRFVVSAFFAVMILLVSACTIFAGQGDGKIMDYHSGAAYVPQTPSVSGGAVGAFVNPASWATNDWSETAFWWNDASVRGASLDNWGFSTGRHLGFAMQRTVLGTRDENHSLQDYQLGLAFGNRAHYFGLAYRWAGGADDLAGRENAWVLGFIERPAPWVSCGISGAFAGGGEGRLGVADLGVRPFGKPWLTLFGDYSLRESERVDGGHWGAGVEIRPISGIHLGVKLRDAEGEDDYSYSLHFGLTLDQGGLHVLPNYDQEGERRHESGTLRPTTYLVRFDQPYSGLPVRDFLRRKINSNRYVELDFHDKRLTYQKAKYFDDRRIAWIDLAEELDRIKEDRSVRGLAINLSGFSARMTLGWEFREKLKELQKAGKEIIIYLEESGVGAYYVASVADHLVLDPHGDVMMPGFAAKRTYMKGLLDKAGIGFDEWRFMKYKSAYEMFSRKDLSDADRDQIGRAIDLIYGRLRDDITEARGWDPGHFDRVVEEDIVYVGERAVEYDVVDRIGRWHELDDWLEKERDGATLEKPLHCSLHRTYFDDCWGRPPEVALVYALGECSMDTGIRGRATSKYLRELAEKDGVAGVVLRADSPGGAPLPSDLVAEGMEMIQQEGKPVVVTQGNVAGSGGYWISMPGDPIYTTPLTVTGSIGVIGGWFYDTGLGEKTGFSADGVQRGSHSDLFTGIRFPLLGRLPTRNLTGPEREMIKGLILGLYDEFVGEVADARGMSREDIREVAQGRIWMGEDAVELGLCDKIGTLQDAITEAKRLAGLAPDDEVILTEFPQRKAFEMPRLMPSILGLSSASGALVGWFVDDEALSPIETDDYSILYMKAIAESEGQPLLMVPPETLPEGW